MFPLNLILCSTDYSLSTPLYLKVLVEMSRVQDSEVGDGTTSVTVLASELIREAEKLVDMRIHPQVRLELKQLLMFS